MDDTDYYVEMSRRMRYLEGIAILLTAFLDVSRDKGFSKMTKEDWDKSDKLWCGVQDRVIAMLRKNPRVVKEPMVVNASTILRQALKEDLDLED